MKTEFDLQDIKMFASTTVEMLKPLLKANGKVDDKIIFNQDELAKYLKVSRSWIDQKISHKEIPHFKCGKYPRFKKSEIDKWINKNTIMPIPPLKIAKNGR